MLTEETYQLLRQKGKSYAHNAMAYIDYETAGGKALQIIEDSAVGIGIVNAQKETQLLHWAANSAQELLAMSARVQGALRLNFIPPAFVEPLEQGGWSVYAEYSDMFLQDLQKQDFSAVKRPLGDTGWAAPEELAEVSSVSGACQGMSRGFSGESVSDLETWQQGNKILVYKEENKVVGFCMVGLYGEPSTLWTRKIGVHPAHQNQGIGKALLAAALEYGINHQAKNAFLAVDTENTKAIHLYESFGFSLDQEESEIQMRRNG